MKTLETILFYLFYAPFWAIKPLVFLVAGLGLWLAGCWMTDQIDWKLKRPTPYELQARMLDDLHAICP